MHHTKNTEVFKTLLWHVSTKLFNHRTAQCTNVKTNCLWDL